MRAAENSCRRREGRWREVGLVRGAPVKAHMGSFGSRGQRLWRMNKAPLAISASEVRACFGDLVISCQIKLTYGRRSRRLHQYPACGGRAQEDETILECGFSSQVLKRFAHPDPPELIRSWKI